MHRPCTNCEFGCRKLIADTVHPLATLFLQYMHSSTRLNSPTTTEAEVAFPAPGSSSTSTSLRTHLLLTPFLRTIQTNDTMLSTGKLCTSFVVHISVRKFFLLTNMYPNSKLFLRVLTQTLDDLGKIPDLSLLFFYFLFFS